ncbi:MAG: hypothetical protein CMH83_07655 [Nocardioides sp.]|nr:hypothetical protein [Nocardioides sp.]
MSFLSKAKGRLRKAVDDHGDTISRGIDRAASEADRRTGGKHSARITQASGQAKKALDGLDGRQGGDVR